MGRLDVKIIGCKNLPNVQTIGVIDVQIEVSCEDKTFKTKVAENTVNPKYDETFKFVISDPNSVRLKFKVWNSNLVSDDFLGQYERSLDGLVKGQPQTSWHILTQCKSNAEIGFELLAHDFGQEPQQQSPLATTTTTTTAIPQQQTQQIASPVVVLQQQQQQQPFVVPQQQQPFVGGGGFVPQQQPVIMIPMPQGPTAFAGFVPPVPPQFLNTTGAQGQLTHCRNGHLLSITAPYDESRMTLWCDLCFYKCVGGSGAKQCRACDLDVCSRCQQVYSRLPPKPLCPQGHPLEPRPDPHGWNCDKCRQGGASGKGSMRCSRCDFDVCSNCFVPYVSQQWQNI